MSRSEGRLTIGPTLAAVSAVEPRRLALGVGAVVIGSGIFTVTGTAASGKVKVAGSCACHGAGSVDCMGATRHPRWGRPGAGPAITISFLLVLLACLFAGLCYAELASMIPDRGQHLHLRLRDSGRDFRVDHRLGSDSGVRGREHVGRGGLLRVFAGSGR